MSLVVLAVLIFLAVYFGVKSNKASQKLIRREPMMGKRGWADSRSFYQLKESATDDEIRSFEGAHALMWFFIGAAVCFTVTGASQGW